MRNGITRREKKVLKSIIICYTNNPKARKTKYSKSEWIIIRETFDIWFRCFKFKERQAANTVR